MENANIFFAVAEDDGVLDAGFPHQISERIALSGWIVGSLLQPLYDGCRRCRLGCRFDAFGGMQKFVGQALNFRWHGGGKEQGLPGEGQELADAFDIRNETHVEHAVRLVDHQNLDAVQQQLAADEMIEQPARRRNHHVGPAIELAVLILVGHAADQERHGQLVVLAEDLEMLGDLCGKLARRFKDQRARHAGAGAAAFEPGQHRQHEGSGLTGSGLCDAKQIAACHCDGHGFSLNRGGSFEACRFNGRQDFWAQTKI